MTILDQYRMLNLRKQIWDKIWTVFTDFIFSLSALYYLKSNTLVHYVIRQYQVTQTISGDEVSQLYPSPVHSRHFVAGDSNAQVERNVSCES